MDGDKSKEKKTESAIDISYSKFLETKYKLEKKKVALDFFFSILTTSFAVLGGVISLFFGTEIKTIPKDYTSLLATIISAGVGLAVLFVMARGAYSARQKRRKIELEELKEKEVEIFKRLEQDFNGLINRGGTYG